MAGKYHEVANKRVIHYPMCFSERDLDFVASCLVFIIKQGYKAPHSISRAPSFFVFVFLYLEGF